MARAWADVDLDAVAANAATLRALVGPAEVCAVVKADGYGHGAVPVARAALSGGATWLAVAQAPEATELRAAGLDAPILLLSEPRPDEVRAVVDDALVVTVGSLAAVTALATAGRPSSPIPVHLKIDTGMHRVGAAPEDAVRLATAVADQPALRLDAVWTHCPVADEPDNPFTAEQLARFDDAVAEITAAGIDVPLRHAANSAAAIIHPGARYDLVRCGIAIYGIPPARALDGRVHLEPALRVCTQVASLRWIAAGDGVSYGLHHRAAADTTVATLPIGYADGVTRRLGLAGQPVLIGGQRRPMVGAVTMDQVMVDVGSNGDVEIGDEVVLLGAQGHDRISPDDWATALGTISYEVVCGLGPRVERRPGGS
jgi:alanine racemase